MSTAELFGIFNFRPLKARFPFSFSVSHFHDVLFWLNSLLNSHIFHLPLSLSLPLSAACPCTAPWLRTSTLTVTSTKR